MSSNNQNAAGWQAGPGNYGPGPGYQQPGSGYAPGWQQAGPQPGPGWQQPGYGPGAQQAGGSGPAGGRIDALDVLEGVLKDGFSLSNFTRIARASGSSLWIGAAIGAGLVVMMNRPDVRAAVSGIFSAARTPGKDG